MLPNKPKKIYIHHDILDSPFGAAEKADEGLSRFIKPIDYLCTSSKPLYEAFSRLYEEAKEENKTYKLGYIKLDSMLERIKRIEIKEDSIIYAPSLLDDLCEKHHSLPHYGEEIVGELLKLGYRVIFRPHPQNLDSKHSHYKYVEKIIKKYKNNRNFYLDNNANDYLRNYKRSKIMISDISGTAYTYTFLTQNPVIFISPNEKQIRRDLGDIKFFEYRKNIGEVIEDIKDIKSVIDKIILKKPIYRLKSLKLRDKLIFNLGKAKKELEKIIQKDLNESKCSSR